MTDTQTNGAARHKAASPNAHAVDDTAQAIQGIDELLKNGDLDELRRAVLLNNREKLYLTTKARPRNFIKDTANKTGISRAVLQRIRSIGRLSTEVRTVFIGTEISLRQDVLVEFANKVEALIKKGMVVGLDVLLARELVANPPKVGPRAAGKAPSPIMPRPRPHASSDPEPGTIPFTFDGDRLDVVRLQDGDVGVTLRRLCEVVGIGLSSQLKRLNRTEALGARWAGVVTMTTTAADQKAYPMIVLPRRSIPMWAATLEAGRCAPGVRSKLLAFQDKAADALAAAFLPDSAPFATLVQNAIAPLVATNELQETWSIGVVDLLKGIQRDLASIKHSGARTMLLVPQVDQEESGYSMESMNRYLIEKGYDISPTDAAIRSIAAKLQIIGDTRYGFWNAHNDSIQLGGRPLGESWRFNEAGTQAIQTHAVNYCESKRSHEAAGDPSPRETALAEALDGIRAIGDGKYENLTRTRAQRRPPFPGVVRAPEAEVTRTLWLKEAGNNKIQVIKAIREITGLGLREAKDLTERAPSAVLTDAPQRKCADALAKLQDAGAIAVLA